MFDDGIVVELGSWNIRYGFANNSHPHGSLDSTVSVGFCFQFQRHFPTCIMTFYPILKYIIKIYLIYGTL